MYLDDAIGVYPIGVDVMYVRLNEGYKPRAPQTGDLVRWLGGDKEGRDDKRGLVLQKRGLSIKIYWFSSYTVGGVRRTSVEIMNRGAA